LYTLFKIEFLSVIFEAISNINKNKFHQISRHPDHTIPDLINPSYNSLSQSRWDAKLAKGDKYLLFIDLAHGIFTFRMGSKFRFIIHCIPFPN
jgi:hypothetical protein